MKKSMEKIWKAGLAALLAGTLGAMLAGCSSGKTVETETETPTETEEAEPIAFTDSWELDDGTTVTFVDGLCVASPDGTLVAQIMTDSETGRFFYMTAKNGTVAIEASQLGIAASVDFTEGMTYVEGSLAREKGTEAYTLTSGAAGEVNDPYREISFDLEKDGAVVTVTLKCFDGGVAYRYTLYGEAGETESISGETGEYVFPLGNTVWRGSGTDVNYEFNFVESSMEEIADLGGKIPVPFLTCDEENGIWVLVAEGGVYNDDDPYCATCLYTDWDERSLKVVFGNGQTDAVTKTYTSDGTVTTPWRVAAVTDNLNDIVGATIFTSVNPDPDEELFADTSWIKQGRVAWSWWSEAGDDPVEYDQQFAYIDFAAENGWEYVCIDFGWCLWDDYEAKIEELAEYADGKGVSLMLWYGVNNDNHSGYTDENGNAAYPYYSLLTTEKIEEQLAWCASVGVKAVKIDYFESDDQDTMKLMYECATIAAENQLCVLFHGCNVPSGEQRTFPNVLGYEAVRGAEWFKWNVGSTVTSQLTYLFTRNVLGGMDYTPSGMQIGQLDTTAGYQLAQIVVYESAIPNYASSVFTLEGFAGLPLMNDIPVTWDETELIDGYPGEYLAVARRNGEDWYIGAMTADAWSTTLDLSFLEDGVTYNAYIFKDNADGSDVEVEVTTVNKDSGLAIDLLENGGISVKLTTGTMDLTTAYDDYTFYEAEDSANELTGTSKIVGWSTTASNQFLSGMQKVTGLGSSADNTLTFTNVEVEEDGVYEMRLYFYSGAQRRICYSINGGDAVRTEALTSGLNSVSAETFYVELRAGTNTITFYNDTAKAVDVDRIAISNGSVDYAPTESDTTADEETSAGAGYSYDTILAGAATLAGGAVIENDYVGWLGTSASCTAAFTANVSEAGYYYLQINYCTGEERDVQVDVNGDTQTVTCPGTGSYTSESEESVYTQVYLNAGENTVTLYNATGWAPNIISIGISGTIVAVQE